MINRSLLIVDCKPNRTCSGVNCITEKSIKLNIKVATSRKVNFTAFWFKKKTVIFF